MKYLILLILILFSIQLSAQIEIKDGYYIYDGKGYTATDLGDILKSNQYAFQKYESWKGAKKRKVIIGSAAAIGVVGLMASRDSPPPPRTKPENSWNFDIDLGPEIFIGPLILLTVVISGVVYIIKKIKGTRESKLTQAINIFNGDYHSYRSIDFDQDANITLGQNEGNVGLFITF